MDPPYRELFVGVEPELPPPLEHEHPLRSAEFSPDGTRVLSVDKAVWLWDVASGTRLPLRLRHDSEVQSAKFSLDGTCILTTFTTTSGEHLARVWDVASGEPLSPPIPLGDARSTVVFNPGGTRIIASRDTARVWDVASGKLLWCLELDQLHSGRTCSVGLSPDGMRIVTAGMDRTARVWNIGSDEPSTSLKHRGDSVEVSSAAFSPDGTHVLTISTSTSKRNLAEPSVHTAQVWDAVSGEKLSRPLRHSFIFIDTWSFRDTAINIAAFSSDGTRVVTASDELGYVGTVRVWDAASGKPLSRLLRFGYLESAMFSPDGKCVLAVSSCRALARVFDATSGKFLSQPLRHDCGYLRSAVFSPDGTLIVTAGTDKTARIWGAGRA